MLAGDVANMQKKWPEAAAAYRAALQRGETPLLSTRLHAVLLAAGQKSEADAFAASWMKSHPKDAEFIAYQAELALQRKDYPAAEKGYLSVLALSPQNAAALNNLAWVSAQLQKREAALGYAEKANTVAPDQPAIMDTLAMILADRKDFSRAIELQTRALALAPDNAGLRLNLAKIYLKAGNKAQARAELQTLAKLGDQFSAQAEVTDLLRSM